MLIDKDAGDFQDVDSDKLEHHFYKIVIDFQKKLDDLFKECVGDSSSEEQIRIVETLFAMLIYYVFESGVNPRLLYKYRENMIMDFMESLKGSVARFYQLNELCKATNDKKN